MYLNVFKMCQNVFKCINNMLCIGFLRYGNYLQIEVRGFPNGIFNPWARWITGLALAKNSSVVVVVLALPTYYLPTYLPTYLPI